MTKEDQKRVVDAQCLRDPSLFATYVDCLNRLKAGFYDQEIVDIFLQKWDRFPLDIYDAAAFADLWGMYITGDLAIAVLPFEQYPAADADVEEMNARLSDLRGLMFISESVVSLEGNISATFWGGTQDEDGRVDVTSPIAFQWYDSLRTKDKGVDFYHGSFPLEVGYTDAQKTQVQVKLHHRLARWPYGRDKIYLVEYRNPTNWIRGFVGQVTP